ncbi:MAG: DUF1957 domain-containing protein, partial [Blastocatellia bacterium]|nr:DUF1957 domain-containing protein [Blastocatellia bacterium]
DFFFRKVHYDQDDIQCITPGDFLDSGLPIQVQQPTASSWGENGYYKVWINEGNSWMYPYQHDAERRMTSMSNAFTRDLSVEERSEDITPEGVTHTRILNQMARELLLAQSSDWAFQIYQGTTVQYSSRRFQMHIQRFNMLADMLSEPGAIATGLLSTEQLDLLTEIESRDNIFAEIDWRAYRTDE